MSKESQCLPLRKQIKSIADEQERAKEELSRLTDAAAQAGLQNALAMKMEREQVLGAKRSEYDDLTARLRASDERHVVMLFNVAFPEIFKVDINVEGLLKERLEGESN